MQRRDDGPDWIPIYLVGVALAALLTVIGALGQTDTGRRDGEPDRVAPSAPTTPGLEGAPGLPRPPVVQQAPTPAPGLPAPDQLAATRRLPNGGTRVFADKQFLVAYYGTAGSGALGVLGEAPPDEIMPRLKRAAADFAKEGRKVQPVFELIVTIAHATPTSTGTYSSDIARWKVEQYRRAAHKHGVLLVLDVQPGTANFLDVAKRWAWALKDPWVGLALDPEWRMSLGGVPGQRIGSVGAPEVNAVSKWLQALTERERLPQKVFMVHQFRTDMIRRIGDVVPRPDLAMVQHVDGFGTPSQKLATFRTVIRPDQFVPGFKLFYDEDRPRMSAAAVLRVRPQIKFVSFQ